MQLEKYPEAEQLCREALAADRKRGAEDAGVLAHTLASLGAAYFYSGDLEAAEAPMREALNVRERTFGMHHALTAQSLNDLAGLLYQSGRYEEATSLYSQALPIHREIYGPEHPEVATITNNIGRSELVAGRVDEAEPLLRQSLAMFQKFQGDNYDGLVSPLNSLAMIDAYRGRLGAARSEIQRAESIARLPGQGELLDQVLLNEADIELADGNLARATELLAESKALLQKAHPDSSADAWRYAVWDSVNAQLLAANGDASRCRQCAFRSAEGTCSTLWRDWLLLHPRETANSYSLPMRAGSDGGFEWVTARAIDHNSPVCSAIFHVSR